uniref:Putative group viii salivary lipocalin n=1 Tax=Rhipicephalus pulchellus TaxID=72859 RepID=L7M9E7_RHIPC
MRFYIGSLLFAMYFTLPCQGTPTTRPVEPEKIAMAKQLLEGEQPLFLFRAIYSSRILIGENEFVCWNSTKSTKKEAPPPGILHEITYYDVTKPGSAVKNDKLAVWTLHQDMMVSLQTTHRKRNPTIPGDWWLEEAEENCMVLGMHVNDRNGANAMCLYWITSSTSKLPSRKCDKGYQNKCLKSGLKKYDWSNMCDENNEPRNKRK